MSMFVHILSSMIIMKPYITLEEVIASQGDSKKGYKLLTEKNGCVNGCCSGITIYSDYEFSPKPDDMMTKKVLCAGRRRIC